MSDAPTTTPQGDPKGQEPTKDDKPTGDQPLGDAGKKALDAERDARKKAEGDLSALRKEFDGFRSTLAEAFGVTSDKGGDGDTLTTVQQEVATLRHEALVYRLAATHSITDEDDLELLKSAKAEQAPKLAERLAAKAEAETKPGTPKPDTTQGGAGEPPALNSNALEQALKTKLGIS